MAGNDNGVESRGDFFQFPPKALTSFPHEIPDRSQSNIIPANYMAQRVIEHSCYPNLEQKLFPIIITFAPSFCGS